MEADDESYLVFITLGGVLTFRRIVSNVGKSRITIVKVNFAFNTRSNTEDFVEQLGGRTTTPGSLSDHLSTDRLHSLSSVACRLYSRNQEDKEEKVETPMHVECKVCFIPSAFHKNQELLLWSEYNFQKVKKNKTLLNY